MTDTERAADCPVVDPLTLWQCSRGVEPHDLHVAYSDTPGEVEAAIIDTTNRCRRVMYVSKEEADRL